MQPQGYIFQNWFWGEVLFKFDLHGVVFEMGFYQDLFLAEPDLEHALFLALRCQIGSNFPL